ERREAFRRRRDRLVPALRELGFGVPVQPDGAFYVYADAGRHTDDAYAFCFELLEAAGVAITPGIDFGAHEAATHVRFAYTTGLDRIELALERLRRFLGR
ncbi:MAG TPA: aminotransferase class I/II-fold pyridoxal phosphate-dependent enzyme, partial [Plasticicumulans sp.]|nr:aminotransferase class I/II-fold pyridoxal phosphate-dependent enzyme [Plasticicumulans sp.]